MVSRKGKKARNGSHLQGRMSAVRSDLDALQKDVMGLVNEAGGVATREVRGAVDETVGRLEAWSNENLAGVRKAVRSQPLKACALSIGAGALIGALLLR